MTPAPRTLLSGALLEEFLTQTEEAMDLQAEAGVCSDLCRSALLAMLQRQPCHADSLDSVFRLHQLWLRAGRMDQALKVLDAQEEEVIAGLASQERAQARVSFSFWRAGVLKRGSDTALMQQALADTERCLLAITPGAQPDDAWGHLATLCEDAGQHEQARRCASVRHGLQRFRPERASLAAWDGAELAVRWALSHAAQGQPDAALACAWDAIRALAEASPDQDVNEADWLRLGHALVSVAPETVGTLSRHVRDRLPADWPAPRRRAIDIQLAQLAARQLYHQGQMDDALAKAAEGRFELGGEDEDAFGARVLDWLMEAGREGEAARLAFESVFDERGLAAVHACRLAASTLARGPADVHWTLTLACAALTESLHWVGAEHGMVLDATHHLALAEAQSPAHPAIAVLRALHGLRGPAGAAQALPLLERSVQYPALANARVIEALWTCRIQVHGGAHALALPFVPTSAARHGYRVGMALGALAQLHQGAQAWPINLVTRLQRQYWELGLSQFESFFASGEGRYRDSDVHTYSLLCYSLAGCYGAQGDQWERAIATHLKGHAASPLPEHLLGLVRGYQHTGHRADLVSVADCLWCDSAAAGDAHRTQWAHVPDVCEALLALERPQEVTLWLQRLQDDWAFLSERDQAAHLQAYLSVLLPVLSAWACVHPADAIVQVDALIPQLQAARACLPLHHAAWALQRAKCHERAQALHQAVLALCETDPQGAELRPQVISALQTCRQALRRERPWWRVW